MAFLLLVPALAGLLSACGPGPRADARELPLVVATTSVLGDVVHEIVGDGARLEVLMGPGVDPHEFQPSARQVALLRRADLVVANGLGLEAGLLDTLQAAGAEGAPLLELAPLLDPLPFHGREEHDASTRGGEPEEGGQDPHVWLDPLRMARGVEILGDRLAAMPRGAPEWRQRAEVYRGRVLTTDVAVQALLARVPPEHRLLVSNHDNLGYFAARYGFQVLDTVIPGGTTLAEASARDLARLSREISTLQVPAILVDAGGAPTIAERLAVDAGIPVVPVYTDALGPRGSPGDTYLRLLLEDARRIASALR